MSRRYQGGILGVGFNPLQAPNAPTSVTATGGDASATVTFTAPANVGGSAITGYTGRSTPGDVAATASASPLTFSGLTNGTSYTFDVWALNTYGPSPAGGPSGSVSPAAPRGLFGAAGTPATNVVQYITITSTGNATDFGDLTVARLGAGACASSSRGVWGGGQVAGSSDNTIDYVTIASTGNATDFGDLSQARRELAGYNSSTRGVFSGGRVSTEVNTIDYITIATTGNATDFGDMTVRRTELASCSSPTRGVVAGGGIPGGPPYSNVIDYVTIATTGNATDFGDLPSRVDGPCGCSSATRGVFAGGSTAYSTEVNVISYITIATTGNTTDFGDLSARIFRGGACSSNTRGVFAGGDSWDGSGYTSTNVIEYVTIATTGNATDFGDLLSAIDLLSGCSNVNGGVQ